MKELIKFEINKSIRRPMVLGIFIVILLVDILMIFFGTFGSEQLMVCHIARKSNPTSTGTIKFRRFD